ncbi:MAG: hypothetical protein HY553_16685 [Elusimicrobia bacterium]|nr:hypothetical protein [Elusimicrobiota bacterium]
MTDLLRRGGIERCPRQVPELLLDDSRARWNEPAVLGFWRFVCERHLAFVRRVVWRTPPPWTCDPVLATTRLTNVYRQLDRHSRYLIVTILSDTSSAPSDTLFNVIVFRTFNRITTWEALGGFRAAGAWNLDEARRILLDREAHGEPVFTGRYRISQQGADIQGLSKVEGYIRRIAVIRDQLPALCARLTAARSLAEVHALLVQLPGVGGFTGYGLALDLTYAKLVPFTDDDYVFPGPGARGALDRMLSEHARALTTYTDAIHQLRRDQTALLRAARAVLLGPPLTVANIQHSLCEFGKYWRVQDGGHVKERFVPARADRDLRLWEALPEEFLVPRRLPMRPGGIRGVTAR